MAWPWRETLVRHWVAVVAIGLVAAIAAAAVWESLPGGAASRRVLTPIIEYHRSRYEINRLLWQRTSTMRVSRWTVPARSSTT